MKHEKENDKSKYINFIVAIVTFIIYNAFSQAMVKLIATQKITIFKGNVENEEQYRNNH